MAKKPAIVSISRLAASHREDAKLARERAQKTLAARDALAAAERDANTVCKVADLLAQCQYVNVNVWAHGHGDGAELSVSFDVPCTSLKEGVIPAVLEAALAQGFEPEATASKDYVNEWATQRTYRFRKDYADGTCCSLRITADIKDGSSSCRKVQIGTKLEEVPQYAIACE